jgi:hypothetical protein
MCQEASDSEPVAAQPLVSGRISRTTARTA